LTPAWVELPLWVFLCRSLMAAVNATWDGDGRLTANRAKELLDFSKNAATKLREDAIASFPIDLEHAWPRLTGSVRSAFCPIAPTPYIQKVADVALRLFGTYLNVLRLNRESATHFFAQKQAIRRVLEPDLTYAISKASRFWCDENARTWVFPEVLLELDSRDRTQMRGFCGAGVSLYVKRVSNEADKRVLHIRWKPPHRMSMLEPDGSSSKRSIRTPHARDMQDYIRFMAALSHEMLHYLAPGNTFDVIHQSKALHGWLTYVQVLDAKEMASKFAPPIAHMINETMDELIKKDDNQGEFNSSYFGHGGKASVSGWDVAHEFRQWLDSALGPEKAVPECPFFHRPGVVTTHGVMRAITKHNVVPPGQAQVACCPDPNRSRDQLRACQPISDVLKALAYDRRLAPILAEAHRVMA